MKKLFEPMGADEIEFLRESNYIEGVLDGLDDAVAAWKYIKTRGRLDIFTILKTHRLLMKNRGLMAGEIGAFRRVPVWIGGREGKPWYAVPELMDQWVTGANSVVLYSNPDAAWQLIRDQHVEFEIIHPFIDGNGRMGRILMNWQRVNYGLPILIIRESEKSKYYEWFP